MKKIKTIQEFLKEYYEKNVERLQKDYPGLPFKRFLDEYCDFDHSDPQDDFFMENPAFFEKIKFGVPLEYINFKSFFYKNAFYVNQDVLIPRSETEILVEEALKYIKENYQDGFSLIDVGTGSGVIALTLASEFKRPLTIYASDLSQKAIEVAKVNYDYLYESFARGTQFHFLLTDRLQNIDEKFNLIISNPPYIKEEADQEGVHEQVHCYEPHDALYLKDSEYFNWFETFFSDAQRRLKDNGCFMMEGHEDHLIKLKEQAQKYFTDVSIKQDYTGRDRFLICKNSEVNNG